MVTGPGRTPTMRMRGVQVAVAFACGVTLAAAAGSGATYTNPVVDGDFPDPGVLYDPKTGLYWVRTTEGLVSQ